MSYDSEDDGVALTAIAHPHRPMSLADITRTFEHRFAHVMTPEPISTAPNGMEFVAITHNGVRHDGDDYHTLVRSEYAAALMWYGEALSYVKTHHPDATTLYWRVKPQIESRYWRPCAEDGTPDPFPADLAPIFVKKYWVVYSRMAFGP